MGATFSSSSPSYSSSSLFDSSYSYNRPWYSRYTDSLSSTASQGSSVVTKTLTTIAVMVGVLLLSIFIFQQVRNSSTAVSTFNSSADLAPTAHDGKVKKEIEAAEVKFSEDTSYGIQYWMYIKDWNHRFGQEKVILRRTASTNAAQSSPSISLGATDNSLNVSVSLFGGGNVPDKHTCTVENVPLQKWFAVSVTVFDRNLEVYINGRLVKSCVLPAIPRATPGKLVITPDGGFSGEICTLYTYAGALTPEDTKAFYMAGTPCSGTTPGDDESILAQILGYAFRFSVLDRKGTQLSTFTF